MPHGHSKEDIQNMIVTLRDVPSFVILKLCIGVCLQDRIRRHLPLRTADQAYRTISTN